MKVRRSRSCSRTTEVFRVIKRVLHMNKIFALVTLSDLHNQWLRNDPGKNFGPEFEDTKLTAIIKAQLAREDTASVQAITVNVDNGVAKLKGTVNSPEKKAKAEEITRKVSGVKDVVNNLEVKP